MLKQRNFTHPLNELISNLMPATGLKVGTGATKG